MSDPLRSIVSQPHTSMSVASSAGQLQAQAQTDAQEAKIREDVYTLVSQQKLEALVKGSPLDRLDRRLSKNVTRFVRLSVDHKFVSPPLLQPVFISLRFLH